MLEHVTEEELLKEVSKRLDQNKLTWEIIYYYDRDETKMELKAEEVKFALTFTNKTNIERNYFCRKVYKG